VKYFVSNADDKTNALFEKTMDKVNYMLISWQDDT